MRITGPLLAALAALSLLTGCTTSQVKEGAGHVAGGLLMMALDIALDGPERRADERRHWEDNPANRWDSCLPPCDIGRDKPTEEELEEKARRKRLAEAEEYEAGIDEIIQALDTAEQRSGHPPSDTTARDYEHEDLERLRRRAEALENQAGFDEFMQELDEAEQRSNDPPVVLITEQ